MLPVYILSGGRSSRFGSDKARALLDGQPLVVHVARSCARVASRLTVVADVEDKYEDLGLRTIADRQPGLGPLGGLHRALEDLGHDEWLLLLSCDLIGLRPEWIERLLSQCHGIDGPAAVAFFGGGRWEPMPALYHRNILQQVQTHLARGVLSLWRLLEETSSSQVALPRDWGDAVVHISRAKDLEDHT
jgi:molybdopterin-guanine dinucleotide biosynthesis protein A